MARFAGLAQATLITEMDLHRSYAAEWGISADELERERQAPTTRGYVDFLLRTAALGDSPSSSPRSSRARGATAS